MELLDQLPPVMQGAGRYGHVCEGMDNYATHYTALAADSGASFAVTSARRSPGLMTTGGTDENEVALFSTKAKFLLMANKSIRTYALVDITELASNTDNFAAGLCNAATGADILVDAGAGPKASFSGAMIYKVDGGSVWRFRSSLGTTYTDAISTTSVGGEQTLEVAIVPFSATQVWAIPLVNGKQLQDSTGAYIKHAITFSGAAAMSDFVYAKTGTGTTFLPKVYKIGAYQVD